MRTLIEVDIMSVSNFPTSPNMKLVVFKSSEPLKQARGTYLSHYKANLIPNGYYASTGGKTILPGPALLEVGNDYFDLIVYRGVPASNTRSESSNATESTVEILQQEVAELKRQMAILLNHLGPITYTDESGTHTLPSVSSSEQSEPL